MATIAPERHAMRLFVLMMPQDAPPGTGCMNTPQAAGYR